MKQALLVIDVQNDYFSGGKMELAQPEAALDKINLLEVHFLKQGLPIIYIQHTKPKNADFFEAGTVGAELHPKLKIHTDSLIIEKHFPDSFYDTKLEAMLQTLAVEQLVLCGMMTHMCITATTKAVQAQALDPIVVTDATATKELIIEGKKKSAADIQAESLSQLEKFAKLQTTNDFLFTK